MESTFCASAGVLDGIACALLAAAAASRAKTLGAHFTGAVVLGCLAGIAGPLLRECFLHGQPGTAQVLKILPPAALTGAMGAVAVICLWRNRQQGIFFWLDSISMGLASALGAIQGTWVLGIMGGLCVGLINGLAAGFVRDVALGDTAMLVDRDWYAMAAAIGCTVSIGVFILIAVVWISDFAATYFEACSVACGAAATLCLRALKGRKGEF